MASAAAVLQGFQSNESSADVNRALSLASGISASVKNKATTLRVAYLLHKMNRILDGLFQRVQLVSEGKIVVMPNPDALRPESLQETSRNLVSLYRRLESTYEALRRAGLLNNSLTAGQLLKLHNNAEGVLDFVDWFDTLAKEDEVRALLARGSREREQGAVHDLDR